MSSQNKKPIIFNSDMVKAILAGHKTQTRRVLKVQPPSDKYKMILQIDTTSRERRKNNDKYHWAIVDGLNIVADQEIYFKLPYGGVGDRLWVRETIRTHDDEMMTYVADGAPLYPSSDDERAWVWTRRVNSTIPSIYMPRWASRILLEVTDDRVEWVQEITPAACEKEGLELTTHPNLICGKYNRIGDDFHKLWDSNNAKRGYAWEANPKIRVIKFKVLEKGKFDGTKR